MRVRALIGRQLTVPRQQCTVCLHADLPAIEAALKSAASVRAVAGRFGLSKTAVDRHRNHGKHERDRINTGEIDRIDREIAKLHRAENRAKRRRDNAGALQIAKELRSWFTLRVKAEAISGAREVQQTQQMTHGEAVAMARTIVEAEVTSGSAETIEWLRGLLERVQHVNKTDEPADSTGVSEA
jgi:hypothetical protein